MTNPDKPLIEVETEQFPKEDRLHVEVSIDIRLAVLLTLLALVACGATVLLILQR